MNQTIANVPIQESCEHCGNPIESKIFLANGNEGKKFCCEGCKTVYSLIHSLGGSYYYNLKGSTKVDPVFGKQEQEPIDTDIVYEKFVRTEAGISEVFIQITNIHCSACVWINEKILTEEPGIHSATINFASGRAKIKFDANSVKLSRILSIIQSIGYKPQLFSPNEISLSKRDHLKSLFLRIGVAGFSFGNIMLFSVALYSGYFSGIEMDLKRLFHYMSWIFATPAYLYSGYPFWRGFLTSIQKRSLSMDFLLFFGISLAYFYSVYVTITDVGEVYFDSVAMIYFFILIGKYFEEKARLFASEKLESILCKLPETTIRITGGIENLISSDKIQKGDLLKVPPGKRVAVDAILVSKKLHVDESFLTGESEPVRKNKGDLILAGSLAIDEVAQLEAKTDYQSSTLSSLKMRLEEALHEKPKAQILTERIAAYFITTVFLLAGLTFLYWFTSTNNLESSLVTTIAVLIVACPCALGISVPTALVTNHILNAEQGVLLKNPSVVESLAQVDAVCLDKTGTLTEGKFCLRNTNIPQSYLPLVYAVEKEIQHPIARSITHFLERMEGIVSQANKINVESIENIPGKGVVTQFLSKEGNKTEMILGNEALFFDRNISFSNMAFDKGTQVICAVGGVYIGSLSLSDEIRKGANSFVKTLKRMVSSVAIVSGDRLAPVETMSSLLSIPEYYANQSPENKKEIILKKQAAGQIVAMVGDGINDSLALTHANVSISHTEAEDLSLEKSDVVLSSGNLNGIVYTIQSAKKTRQVILQNIIISFCYNSIMLPLAMFGYMLPVLCSIFMALSSLTVLLNSLSLRYRVPVWKHFT